MSLFWIGVRLGGLSASPGVGEDGREENEFGLICFDGTLHVIEAHQTVIYISTNWFESTVGIQQSIRVSIEQKTW